MVALVGCGDYSFHIYVYKMQDRWYNLQINLEITLYTHLEKISLEEGVQVILNNLHMKPKQERVTLGNNTCHVTSLRLRTFALKGTSCYICNLKATHFSVDIQYDGQAPHLNLWGSNPDGELTLFTHDHVLARSLGGKDKIENTKTCCTICNFEKAKLERIEVAKRHAQKRVHLEESVV